MTDPEHIVPGSTGRSERPAASFGERLETTLAGPIEVRRQVFIDLVEAADEDIRKSVMPLLDHTLDNRNLSARQRHRIESRRADQMKKMLLANIVDIRMEDEDELVITNLDKFKRDNPNYGVLEALWEKYGLSEDELAALSRYHQGLREKLGRAESDIWGFVAGEVRTIPDWEELKDWAVDNAQARDVATGPVLEMFAIDALDEFSPRRLLGIFRQAQDGSVVARRRTYLEAAQDSPQDPAAGYLQDVGPVVKHYDPGRPAVDSLSELADLWPERVAKRFEAREAEAARQEVSDLGDELRRNGYLLRYQQIPHPSRGVTPLLHKIFEGQGKGAAFEGRSQGHHRKHYGRTTPKSVIRAEAGPEAAVFPENDLFDVRIQNGVVTWTPLERDEPPAAATKFLKGYAPNEDIVTDVANMIYSLKREPAGNGATPMRQRPIIDETGKKIKLWYLSARERAGLPLNSRLAYDTRVVYVPKRKETGGNDVGIVTILRHDDFDNWNP